MSKNGATWRTPSRTTRIFPPFSTTKIRPSFSGCVRYTGMPSPLVINGLARTVKGPAVAVIEVEPDCPSLVAVIGIGPPALTAVTKPLPSTVAIAVLDDDQVIA